MSTLFDGKRSRKRQGYSLPRDQEICPKSLERKTDCYKQGK